MVFRLILRFVSLSIHIITLAGLTTSTILAQAKTEGIQDDIYRARDRVMPAVVHIQPVSLDYRTGEMKKQSSVGSGVIYHPDGYVVTNYHVAGKAQDIICTLNDRELVPAVFIGGDPAIDIAVIKLDLSEYNGKLAIAEFGNSDDVHTGQMVVAIGSPLSLARTVSFGVVSTTDRYFSSDITLPTGERTGRYNLWIQTDAAINPGNSGGPLVDMNGEVVGINSRANFYANNLGFAIPINVVRESADAILKNGKVTRSWIGLHCQALQELESHFNTDGHSGVLIASVDPGSPAEKSFLKAGDIILEVNDQPVSARFVEELPAFYRQIASFSPGTELKFVVRRDDSEYTFGVVTQELGELQGDDFEAPDWGFAVKEITQQMGVEMQFDDIRGVFVTGVKRLGAADEGGLRRGDVVKTINQSEISDLASFGVQYQELVKEEAAKILIAVQRGGGTRLVVLTVSHEEGDQE